MKRDFANPLCAGCQRNLFKMREYAYMIKDVLWQKMMERHRRCGGKASTYDLLCIGCFATRLGRNLDHADFNWAIPLNSSTEYKRSKRLLQAMRTIYIKGAYTVDTQRYQRLFKHVDKIPRS